MEMSRLTHTDLRVSWLCFGTMTLGKPVNQEESSSMADLCLSSDINRIDTATPSPISRPM